jgi:two-component system LytT family sensor kinase
MPSSFSTLTYQQKSIVAEITYLLVIGVLSPLAVGLQTFSWISYTLSYVLLNIMGLPVLLLFYRVYLPQTIGRRRYLLAAVLFPFYILLYELSDRLCMLALINLPFIPAGYRDAIRGAHPENLTSTRFNEHFGYTTLVLLAATSLYVVKLLFKNRHRLNTLETEKLKLELNHLKSQVQPHFFFNTLNNLYSLSVQGSPKTPLMINDLSGIMRYILYDTRNDKVPLRQEVEFINSYIRLENLRHTREDIVDFAVQGDIRGILIEPLLFLPLIENTFKHALHQEIPDKWVKLVLAADDEELIFQASNPQPAVRQGYDKSRSGIGLHNVRQRLALLYPGRHELVIHDEEDIFTVNLTIKVKYE